MDKIADILSQKGTLVHTIEPTTSVYEAISRMDRLNVGALVVLDSERVHGIISERDYLQKIALLGRTSRETTVGEIMTRKVAFVSPVCDVEEALAIMTERRCRHLPVMEGGRLAGLVSIGDCVKQIIHKQEVRIQYLEDYINDPYPGPTRGA
jgi:CBS domain-containing protein